MMNKTEESPFQLATRQGSELAPQESESVSRLRRALRIEFKRDPILLSILGSKISDEEKAESVRDALSERFEQVTPEDIRREAISLIQEFAKLEVMGIREVVTDSRGRAITPLRENTIFYPTRIDEHGNKSQGFPMLHPAIASEVMLREVDQREIDRLEHLSPVFAFNVQVERDSSQLEARIREDLRDRGWKIETNDGDLYTEIVGRESKITIFGKERNPAFSRVPIWSIMFIRSLPENRKTIELVAFERCEDDSYRWYEITYRASE